MRVQSAQTKLEKKKHYLVFFWNICLQITFMSCDGVKKKEPQCINTGIYEAVLTGGYSESKD